MAADFSDERAIAPDHPSLAGHFPGNPVVPGVVLLEEVMAGVEQWRGAGCFLSAVPTVKFLRPLQPGQAFTLELVLLDEGRVRFICQRVGVTLAQGVLVIEGRRAE